MGGVCVCVCGGGGGAHARTAKAQLRLRMRTYWSRLLVSANRIFGSIENIDEKKQKYDGTCRIQDGHSLRQNQLQNPRWLQPSTKSVNTKNAIIFIFQTSKLDVK